MLRIQRNKQNWNQTNVNYVKFLTKESMRKQIKWPEVYFYTICLVFCDHISCSCNIYVSILSATHLKIIKIILSVIYFHLGQFLYLFCLQVWRIIDEYCNGCCNTDLFYPQLEYIWPTMHHPVQFLEHFLWSWSFIQHLLWSDAI